MEKEKKKNPSDKQRRHCELCNQLSNIEALTRKKENRLTLLSLRFSHLKFLCSIFFFFRLNCVWNHILLPVTVWLKWIHFIAGSGKKKKIVKKFQNVYGYDIIRIHLFDSNLSSFLKWSAFSRLCTMHTSSSLKLEKNKETMNMNINSHYICESESNDNDNIIIHNKIREVWIVECGVWRHQ